MPKIIHYREECIGCHACVDTAPDNWEMSDKDGKSILKRSVNKKGKFIADISKVEMEKNVAAAHNCPVKIIRVVGNDGKEIW